MNTLKIPLIFTALFVSLCCQVRGESGFTFYGSSAVATGDLISRGAYYTTDSSYTITSTTFSNITVLQNFGSGYFPGEVYFPELEFVISDFNMDSRKVLYAPKLKAIMGTLTINSNQAKAISFPSLEIIGNNLTWTASGSSPMESVSFPSLKYIAGQALFTNLYNTTSINLNSLERINSALQFRYARSVSTISLPSLKYAYSNLNVYDSSGSLTTIEAPNIINIGGTLYGYLNMGSLSDITTLCSSGTIKSITSSIDFSSNTLTQASVDHMLEVVASLDGTNGTTSWGTGKTLSLDGTGPYGSNASPSAAGLANKAIIQARGATVKTN